MLRLSAVTVDQDGFRLRADLEVRAGSRVAVIGASGAGKSTLLNAIAGFVPLTSGRISWAGQDITDLRPGARPIAMLFQDNNLFPHLTLAQNVGLGLRRDLRLTSAEKEQVSAALDRVGLAQQQTRKPGTLSGGQQSRAALARVLVQRRPLLLLDEPFAALGPALRQEMLDLMLELTASSGATLLMVTHAPQDARRMAGDVIFVDAGQVHPPQSAEQAMNEPNPALKAYLG